MKKFFWSFSAEIPKPNPKYSRIEITKQILNFSLVLLTLYSVQAVLDELR